MMLAAQIEHVRFLDGQVKKLDREMEERMRRLAKAVEALDGIPGVGRLTAEEVLAETGDDMSRFPSAAHPPSWAGLCPGNNESAGKRKSGRMRPGNPHLRATLVEATRSAARTKNTYLSARYHRLAARRGGNRAAAVAVAQTILVIIYHMLKEGTAHRDLGADYFDKLNRDAVPRRAIKRLEALGYKVTLERAAWPPLPGVHRLRWGLFSG